jgi:hypothetical protein
LNRKHDAQQSAPASSPRSRDGGKARDNVYGSGEPFIEIEHEGVRIH